MHVHSAIDQLDLPSERISWRVLAHEEVESTNDLAATAAPWTVVVAQRQRQGRGRYGRSWVSDEGGLWLSAVVPTPGPAERWAVLPLAAGWALRRTLQTLVKKRIRLRWPNDVMVGPAKLAGILVERFRPETAVIGIGLNWRNAPDQIDASLQGQVVRLSDLAERPITRENLLDLLLVHLTRAQHHLADGHINAWLPTLNEAWANDRVAVTLRSGETLNGALLGVDAEGRLVLQRDDGAQAMLSPLEVEKLRELTAFP